MNLENLLTPISNSEDFNLLNRVDFHQAVGLDAIQHCFVLVVVDLKGWKNNQHKIARQYYRVHFRTKKPKQYDNDKNAS